MLQTWRLPLTKLEPEDLLKYGLIPEFIGRLPVVATLEDLQEEHLLFESCKNPKNSLIKQYEKLFSLENVKNFFYTRSNQSDC